MKEPLNEYINYFNNKYVSKAIKTERILNPFLGSLKSSLSSRLYYGILELEIGLNKFRVVTEPTKAREELIDMMPYLAILCDELNLSLDNKQPMPVKELDYYINELLEKTKDTLFYAKPLDLTIAVSNIRNIFLCLMSNFIVYQICPISAMNNSICKLKPLSPSGEISNQDFLKDLHSCLIEGSIKSYSTLYLVPEISNWEGTNFLVDLESAIKGGWSYIEICTESDELFYEIISNNQVRSVPKTITSAK